VLAAADPAQLYGAALRWPETEHAPSRRPGAYVVQVGGQAVLAVEAGGRSLYVLGEPGDADLDAAFAALAAAVRDGRLRRLALEKIDGVAAVESPHRERLLAVGFRPALRRLTLEKSGV
jgi:ATP-dependent Lhr-like helicase